MSQFEREKTVEYFRYTPNWIPDRWDCDKPSGDFETDLTQFESRDQSKNVCLGCTSTTSFDCIECTIRDFGLEWLPKDYSIWSAKEKEEWKLRITGGSHGCNQSGESV